MQRTSVAIIFGGDGSHHSWKKWWLL